MGVIGRYAKASGKCISDETVGGESETMIGKWLKETGHRNDVIIASKMTFPYPGVDYGSSPKKIKEECEKSLKRLGVDTIDLYYMHSDDFDTPMEESLKALNDLYKEGKIKAIGASNFKAWRLERARQISTRENFIKYCCIQQRYSYLRPKAGSDFGGQIAANEDLLEYVKDTNMQLLAYSPLLHGAYTDNSKSFKKQYIGPDSDARLKVLDEISKETGATKNQLVYAWLLNSNPMSIPLIASTTDEQFTEAIGSLNVEISQEQIDKMSSAGF